MATHDFFKTPPKAKVKKDLLKTVTKSGSPRSSGDPITVYLYDIQTLASISLVSLEESPGQDGFTYDLQNQIETPNSDARRLQLYYVGTRRISKGNEATLENVNPTGSGRDRKNWPRKLFFRPIPENRKSTAERKYWLENLAGYLNSLARKRAKEDGSNMPMNRFKVPDDWDRSEYPLKPLDYYVRDFDIFKYIKGVLVHEGSGNWKTWAQEFPAVASGYFSEPYGHFATMIGFRNPDWEQLFQENPEELYVIPDDSETPSNEGTQQPSDVPSLPSCDLLKEQSRARTAVSDNNSKKEDTKPIVLEEAVPHANVNTVAEKSSVAAAGTDEASVNSTDFLNQTKCGALVASIQQDYLDKKRKAAEQGKRSDKE